MGRNLEGADVLGEQRAIADLTGQQPSSRYVGAVSRLIDQSVQRAQQALKGAL
jgi:3-carboxy-cis,cis-muconate cycloisomerase